MRYLIGLGLAVLASAQPAWAEDQAMAGLRLELRAGMESVHAKSTSSSLSIGEAFSIGAEAGYDVPVGGGVTVGPFINYDYARSEYCNWGCAGPDGNYQAGVRLGVNVGPRTQVYAKGGYDGLRYEAEFAGATQVFNTHGWMIGGGIDQAIGKKVYVGIEVNYADHLSNDVFEPEWLNRLQVAGKVGLRF